MPNSQRFREVKRRLYELRRHFLPKRFSPTGTYTQRQLDLTRAYRLLAHAEIESFIEDISRETVIAKIREWKSSRKASDLIICFLASYHSGWNEKTEGELFQTLITSGTAAKERTTAEEAVDAAVNQFLNQIRNNHGVRQKDLKQMLLPLGVRFSELDPNWITNLDDFGKQRGDIAHNSVSVARIIDPQTELQRINELLVGLRKLDEIVVKIIKS